MSDFGQTLLSDISKRFNANLRADKKIRQLARKVRDSTDYNDASQYASRLGELLSEAMNAETVDLSFMSEEVARELLFPLLEGDYGLVCEAVEAVQKNMYSSLETGLNVALPELDTNRIEGLVKKIASYDTFEEARWLIDEPIVNYSMSVVDQGMRDNAKKASGVGFTAKIVREPEPFGLKSRKIGRKTYTYRVPCKWCSGLAGKWDYEDAPDDVYKRHAFCRCTVTYTIDGSRQDVYSKRMWSESDASAKAEQIREAEQRVAEDYARLNVRKIVSSLTVNERGARKILSDYGDEIARDGLATVVERLRNNQKLLNQKYR